VISKFRKFPALSYHEKMLFFEALSLQLSIGLLLKVIPFKWIPRLFSNPRVLTSQVSPMKPDAQRLTPDTLRLEEIKIASQRADRLTLWKNKCLVQSLAARWMLKKRGIQSKLSLGVALGQDKNMIAHAWIKAGDFEVVEQNGDYHELYLF
jgi:Transglutaminase-like superfamily